MTLLSGWRSDLARCIVKILLVEDDDDIAEPLIIGLRREGFDVSHVGTASAAVSAAIRQISCSWTSDCPTRTASTCVASSVRDRPSRSSW